jgi:hypothetical protein
MKLELHDAAARLQAGVHQTAAVTRMIVVWTRRRRHGTRMRNPQWAIEVKIHLHNIFRKLRVSNRTALAAMLFNRSRR